MMRPVYDREEIPLELVRRKRDSEPFVDDEPGSAQARMARSAPADRFRPATSGAIMGTVAGAAALGVLHLMVEAAFVGLVARVSEQRAIPFEAGLAIAYVGAGAAGALIGAFFASVTKYLRRWLPLEIWSLVFFGSVAMVAVAAARTWAHGPADPLMRAVFSATGLFAFLIPFSLTIRKKKHTF